MCLPSSGQISINDIRNELGLSTGSLRDLSAAVGWGTPDAMSEFYGYCNAPGSFTLYQDDGGWYDGCNYVDDWGWLTGTAPNSGSIGPWDGSGYTYNSEGFGGTFLTFGGYCTGTLKANTGTSVTFYAQPLYDFGCATGICYITLNGSTVVSQYYDSFNGNTLYYEFTAASGGSYTFHMGIYTA
jgi:hypothetical protein